MLKLSTKLRIGEKIALGFGLVGLLFLGVISKYNTTLNQTLTNYQRLHHVHEAEKSYALKIANKLYEARIAEKRFLIQRDEKSIKELQRNINAARSLVSELGKIDKSNIVNTSRIEELLQGYHEHFLSVVAAWKAKGLDHNSGLQGEFRETAHELESIAGQFNAGALYLQLLKIHRAEKEMGFNHGRQHSAMISTLAKDFLQLVNESKLQQEVKAQLQTEARNYSAVADNYSQSVYMKKATRSAEIQLHQAANRIEMILNSYYVPDLETNILQLRRREKDYLLRHDRKYVRMALHEMEQIKDKIDASGITQEDKGHVNVLLERYQGDFLALVEQNKRIDQLIAQMTQEVEAIIQMVQTNVVAADQAMAKGFSEVNAVSEHNKYLMYWSVVVATLLAVGFVVFLTLSIARPLRNMVKFLDKLAYEEPTQRMPFDPKGRDEVNAMAISLNTMADYKKRFIDWWIASMGEEHACEKLRLALIGSGNEIPKENLKDVSDRLWAAIAKKKELLTTHCQGIVKLSRTISEKAEELMRNKPSGDTLAALDTILHSAQAIRSLPDIVYFQGDKKMRGREHL